MPSLLQAPKPVANPLAQGTLNLQPKGAPFVITGLKAKAPGTTIPPTSPTLKSSQVASQQTATSPTYALPGNKGSIVPPAAPITPPVPPTPPTPPAPAPVPTLNGTVGQLLNTATGNITIGQQAQAISNKYAPQFQALLPQYREGGTGTVGTTPVVQGNAANAVQTASAESNLLSQAQSAEMAGIQPQLTAQLQQEQAQAAAGGLQTPGNQFIQQAPTMTLIGADGQPVQQAAQNPDGSYTNALTGAPLTSTGNARLDNAVANALQAIKAGAGYSNAISAAGLSAYGPMGSNALNNALPKGFNVNASNASAAAQAQNINTTGTASANAANTAYTNAVQAVSKATAALTATTGVANNLTSTLGTWSQNGQLTDLNQAINKLASLTSSPEYAQFNAALLNAQSTYTAAFQNAGIIPTQGTQNALNELNPNSSASAIVASLNQLSSDLHAATVVPAYQQQQTYAQQLGIQ